MESSPNPTNEPSKSCEETMIKRLEREGIFSINKNGADCDIELTRSELRKLGQELIALSEVTDQTKDGI